MSDFRNDPNFANHEMHDCDSRVQWAAVAVILLLVGGMIFAAAYSGGDTQNAIKAAKEFGISKTMKLAGLLVFITDIHSLGLKNTEGLLLTTSWDWNLDDASRAFGRKFFDKTQRMPTDLQAADYSATMNYLKAVRLNSGMLTATVLATVMSESLTMANAMGLPNLSRTMSLGIVSPFCKMLPTRV